MSPDNHSKTLPTRPDTRRRSGACLLRLILVLSVAGILLIAGLLLLSALGGGGPLGASANLDPVKSVAYGAYLALNRDGLETPAEPGAEPEIFAVEAGQSAAQIAERLAAEGMIGDTTLFLRYLSYHGLDTQIEAGTYRLSGGMTIPELAYQLTEAEPPFVTLAIPEGWRREQIAERIDAEPELPFSGDDFLAATGPGATIPAGFSFAGEIPDGASLEGFLFPDTYRLAIDSTAQDLVTQMLTAFDQRVTPELPADGLPGLTLYEVVTVASIVEREARVADERTLIADVYLNRYEQGMMLQADPTVQYAMGYHEPSGEWWNRSLTQADYTAVDSPYNTYLYAGLPLGPIANPGIEAIRAVIRPADTPYLYFRTTCDGSGRHNFAISFEEHVANACP